MKHSQQTNAIANDEVIATLADDSLTDEVRESHLQAELSRLVELAKTFSLECYPIDDLTYLVEVGYFGHLDFLHYAAAVASKHATLARNAYLPYDLVDSARKFVELTNEVQEWREDFVLAVCEAVRDGNVAHAITRGFEAIAKAIDSRDDYKSRDRKTLPKEEVCDRDLRFATQQICSLNPEGVEPEQDECSLPPLGAKKYFSTPKQGNALVAAFDEVKRKHPYATAKRWKCFEYVVLKKPTAETAKLLAISKQRVSAMASEVRTWIRTEIENLGGTDKTNLPRINP